MGITDRKEREKEEMRRLILDASMKLFTEQGFESVSIRKIADLIEYSPTTIYLNFQNKDEILLALHEEGFLILDQKFQALLTIENPFERLQKFGEVYLEFGLQHPEYYDLMFLKVEPMDALFKHDDQKWKSGDHAFAYLLKTTEEILVLKPKLGIDPLTAAMSFWSMVHGFVCLQLRNRICWYNEEARNFEQAGFMGLKWMTQMVKDF